MSPGTHVPFGHARRTLQSKTTRGSRGERVVGDNAGISSTWGLEESASFDCATGREVHPEASRWRIVATSTAPNSHSETRAAVTSHVHATCMERAKGLEPSTFSLGSWRRLTLDVRSRLLQSRFVLSSPLRSNYEGGQNETRRVWSGPGRCHIPATSVLLGTSATSPKRRQTVGSPSQKGSLPLVLPARPFFPRFRGLWVGSPCSAPCAPRRQRAGIRHVQPRSRGPLRGGRSRVQVPHA